MAVVESAKGIVNSDKMTIKSHNSYIKGKINHIVSDLLNQKMNLLEAVSLAFNKKLDFT